MEYVGDMFTTAAIDEDDEFWDSEEVQFDMDDLIEALNNNLPPFVYFGTLEGDGSDFGFWPDMDSLNEAMQYGDVTFHDDERILDEHDVIIQVSDHGNVTLMNMERDVIWALS
jgi:phosphopentomutase